MKPETTPGFVIWFTGLPSAGKSTLAHLLQQQLAARQIPTQLLDSDELRRQLTPRATYSPAERDWFYDTIIFLAQLLSQNGVNVLIAATAPRRHYRETARARLPRFAEVFVDCPPKICQARDPKGLWQLAAEGKISSLPGADATYEPPLTPEVRVNTEQLSPEASVEYILRSLLHPLIYR
jgi:adenylylsulfate kinase